MTGRGTDALADCYNTHSLLPGGDGGQPKSAMWRVLEYCNIAIQPYSSTCVVESPVGGLRGSSRRNGVRALAAR
eukprot:6597690-Prymnesium_polylepis.1